MKCLSTDVFFLGEALDDGQVDELRPVLLGQDGVEARGLQALLHVGRTHDVGCGRENTGLNGAHTVAILSSSNTHTHTDRYIYIHTHTHTQI